MLKVAGGNIKTTGNFAVKSVINIEMETYVEAGNDAYEDADGKSTSDKADRKYDSLDAAVSVSLGKMQTQRSAAEQLLIPVAIWIFTQEVDLRRETTAKGDAGLKRLHQSGTFR